MEQETASESPASTAHRLNDGHSATIALWWTFPLENTRPQSHTRALVCHPTYMSFRFLFPISLSFSVINFRGLADRAHSRRIRANIAKGKGKTRLDA